MWLWSCSCASACPRFSTCGPRSPTSSAGNSANWLKQPPGRSKPASFCPTAAFASPRMAVSAAPIWASAWETNSLSRPNSSASPEPATLIGLTSLTTNGRPLLPPKLNRRRALLVLAKIEEILAWEQTTDQERDPLRGAGPLPVRGPSWAVLAVGQSWFLRRVPGEALPRISAEGLLPDGHPRAPAANPKTRPQAGGVDQGERAGEGRSQGWAAV